ncbi:MAG: Secretion system C-terminal sorting domain [Bacteroidota bacterium]|jgi:hypothetical protein
MKKIITLSFVTFLLLVGNANAQIPNASFENVLSNGLLSNWKPPLLVLTITIDSNGISHTDSLSSFSFYQITNDAHSGNKALELHNIYNYTQQINYAASISVGNDSDSYSSFSNSIQLTEQPGEFNFYYKYFPINNDSAYAHADIFDSLGNLIGDANIILSGTVNTYSKATASINYTINATAKSAMLNIATSLPNSTNSHFGTRLLIDDISFKKSTVGIQNINVDAGINIFPNPAQNQIEIKSENAIHSFQIKNIAGDVFINSSLNESNSAAINTNKLPNGVYIVEIELSNKKMISKKIVISK